MHTSEPKQKRSPVQDRMVNRKPGETLQEELSELYAEFSYFMGAGILIIILAAISFILIALGYSITLVLAAQIIVGFASVGLGIRRLIKHGGRLKRGLDAEIAVGQELHALESMGYHIIHDVPSLGRRGANIDHVLIGPSGVYAIETKYKTKEGDHRLDYNGQTISVCGHPLRDSPIPQARAVAHDLELIIKENTGLVHKAIPVVLYPGWFVNNGQLKLTAGHVNVLSDKHFVLLVKNLNMRVLPPADVASIRAGILRHAEGTRKNGLHK